MQADPWVEANRESRREFGAGALLACLSTLLAHYGHHKPLSVLGHAVASAHGKLSHAAAVELLERQGFVAEWGHGAPSTLIAELFPVVLALKDDDYCVLLEPPADGRMTVIFPLQSSLPLAIASETLAARLTGLYLLCQADRRPDAAPLPGHDAADRDGHWLFGTLKLFKGFYQQAILASLLSNLLAVATSFYSMNIYDRVIPHKGYSTLLALTIGVGLAIVFEHVLKHVRVQVLERTARRADFILSRKLFRHLQVSRLEHLPSSPGALANVLREYESVREILTSATLTGLADLPFAFLFIALIAWIGHWLALVPVAVMAVMAVFLVAVQRKLAYHANAQLSASSSRHGLLIETIEGLETVKATRAEGVLLSRWDQYNEEIGAHNLASRTTQAHIGSFIAAMQQGSTILLMGFGAYLAAEGYITSGVLVAAAILNGRILAPLAQVGGLALRYQQARKAFETLEKFMRAPTDCDGLAERVVPPRGGGHYEVQAVDFAYAHSDLKALNRITLTVPAGAHVALLGEIGSGKSTLLRILAGLYRPESGMVKLDGVDLQQIHPASLRERVGVLSQEPRLFSGTLLDNLLMGAKVPDQRFIEVVTQTGVQAIASAHPQGYHMRIGDKGASLSGGQKQLIAWARMLLASPDIVLMDEPTGAMDPATEQQFIRVMRAYLKDRTMVLITHRIALLELVERVAVIQHGAVQVEGDKSLMMRQAPNANPLNAARPSDAPERRPNQAGVSARVELRRAVN